MLPSRSSDAGPIGAIYCLRCDSKDWSNLGCCDRCNRIGCDQDGCIGLDENDTCARCRQQIQEEA